MKITKKQLKQLIQEEIDNFETEETIMTEEGDVPAEIKQERDVDVMLRTIEKINTPQEYQQVLDAVVAHGAAVRGGKIALTKLSRTLAQTASKMN